MNHLTRVANSRIEFCCGYIFSGAVGKILISFDTFFSVKSTLRGVYSQLEEAFQRSYSQEDILDSKMYVILKLQYTTDLWTSWFFSLKVITLFAHPLWTQQQPHFKDSLNLPLPNAMRGSAFSPHMLLQHLVLSCIFSLWSNSFGLSDFLGLGCFLNHLYHLSSTTFSVVYYVLIGLCHVALILSKI